MGKHLKMSLIFSLFIVILLAPGCSVKDLLSGKNVQPVSTIKNVQETNNQKISNQSIKEAEDVIKESQKVDEQEKESQSEVIKDGKAEKRTESKSNLKPEDEEITENSNMNPPESKPAKSVYLTFDDGPSAVTGEILDVLKKHNIKATFFVNGIKEENNFIYSQMIKRIVNEGHAIGNHGYTHDYHISYASKKSFKENVDKLDQCLQDIVGVKTRLFRFQGGSSNTVYKKYLKDAKMKDLFSLMHDNGFRYFDWNVDTRDSEEDTPSESRTIKYALNGLKGKTDAIVLMHDSKDKIKTPKAVDIIIEKLKKQGYGFEKLSMDSFNTQHRK